MRGIILGAILGGAFVYFWDPDRGRERRTDARDRASTASHQVTSTVTNAGHQVSSSVSSAGHQVSNTGQRVQGQLLKFTRRPGSTVEDSGDQDNVAQPNETPTQQLNPTNVQGPVAPDSYGTGGPGAVSTTASGASPATVPAANPTTTPEFNQPAAISSEY